MERSSRARQPVFGEYGVEFTLLSPSAEHVELCLFDEAVGAEESRRLDLSRDTDGLWRVTVAHLAPGQLYGYRVHGPYQPERGHRFNPAKLLVDPCAAAITGEPPASDLFQGALEGDEDRPDPRDSGPVAVKSIVAADHFDWGDDKPPRRLWRETVIYECHVRGLTATHPELPPSLRGTYLGLASEPVLDHLERLGITAVELLPVQQIASEPHLLDRGRTNYFGYSPLGLRAPHAAYATEADGRQVDEFKQMVKALHGRGIEVILDIVLNHSAEGDHRGRTMLFRGLDNRLYYRLQPDDLRLYEDFSGCGNTLASAEPLVAQYLVETLRYWVETMHVDGFRFDLAVALGRDRDRFTSTAEFFRRLASEPVLAATKLIAEPWDLGPYGYQLGRFPAGWSEWNDRFRDTARSVWRGDPLRLATLMEIADGSPSIFDADRGGATASINFVTCHDGFTLEDLVSYERKHNWDNGEENRDGHDRNLSRNWGVEGPTDSPTIIRRRDRVKRNLMATLAFARGVPMLLHGDELGRTQRGNNNAYCQDNELTWLAWDLDSRQIRWLEFVGRALELRRRLVPLLFADHPRPPVDRVWTGAGGRPISAADAIEADVGGVWMKGPEGLFYLVVNLGDEERVVRLPRQRTRGAWWRRLATAEPDELRITSACYRIVSRSLSLLEFVPARQLAPRPVPPPSADSAAADGTRRPSAPAHRR